MTDPIELLRGAPARASASVVCSALLSALLSAAGQLLMRSGAARWSARMPPGAVSLSAWLQLLTSPHIALGLTCWAGATLVWLSVLARAPLTLVYGLAGASYLLVPLAAHLLLHEPLHRNQLAGMLLIAAGIALTLTATNGGTLHDPR